VDAFFVQDLPFCMSTFGGGGAAGSAKILRFLSRPPRNHDHLRHAFERVEKVHFLKTPREISGKWTWTSGMSIFRSARKSFCKNTLYETGAVALNGLDGGSLSEDNPHTELRVERNASKGGFYA
jgi:hypothetical protein